MAAVVVVGAGMGGLAVAARLAALGHDVTVVRAGRAVVGGKLGVLARDGFVFDTGPSLLTLPAVYRDLFLATGGPLEDDVAARARSTRSATTGSPTAPRLDLPNASRCRDRPRRWDDALGAGAGADWTAFCDRAGGDLGRDPRGRSSSPRWTGARTLLRQAPPAARPADRRPVALAARARAAATCATRTSGPVLDRYATYTGSDPRRAPAALATVPYVEQTFGAWHVAGGLRRLGDAVHARAVERGATVRTGDAGRRDPPRRRRAARRRRPARGRRAARRPTSSSRTPTPPTSTRDLLPPAVAAGPLRRAAPGRRRRSSGFVLLLALRGRTPGLAHHTVLFPEDYDDEFDAVFGTGPHRRTGRAPCRTRRSTSARPTTRPCAPTTTARRGSCWSTPRGTRPTTRRRRRLGRAGARARPTPTGCSP